VILAAPIIFKKVLDIKILATKEVRKVMVRQSTKRNKDSDVPKVITRPPVIYAFFLMLSFILQYVFYLYVARNFWVVNVGVAMMISGVVIMMIAIRQFKAAGTSYEVSVPSKVLITDGLYQHSRNPIYVALTLVYLGIGFTLNNLWTVIFILPILMAVHVGVIFPEEEYLKKKFGRKYTNYFKQTRRWF